MISVLVSKRKFYRGEGGFTIIELLVATVVFSVVLLLLSSAVISYTKSYYKGITETNTQNVARSIVDTLTNTVQFNGGGYTVVNQDPAHLATDGNWQGFCIGDEGYLYTLGTQLVTELPDASKHQGDRVLLKLDIPGGCGGKTIHDLIGMSGKELLGSDMRLVDLSIAPLSSGLYSLSVNVAYGDDDLLCNPLKVSNSCDSGAATMTHAQDYTIDTSIPNDQVFCKGQTGSQFCATSAISTVVQKRVQP